MLPAWQSMGSQWLRLRFRPWKKVNAYSELSSQKEFTGDSLSLAVPKKLLFENLGGIQ